jgi:hypothetical protein
VFRTARLLELISRAEDRATSWSTDQLLEVGSANSQSERFLSREWMLAEIDIEALHLHAWASMEGLHEEVYVRIASMRSGLTVMSRGYLNVEIGLTKEGRTSRSARGERAAVHRTVKE